MSKRFFKYPIALFIFTITFLVLQSDSLITTPKLTHSQRFLFNLSTAERYKPLLERKSLKGTKEDPHAIAKQEIMMMADPVTGRIPQNIRKLELSYTKKLIKEKKSYNNLKTTGTSENSWQHRGPFNVGGRTRALALDIKNEDIILAGGVSGGMWRSVNAGKAWQKTTDPSVLQSATCIIQDIRPGKENTWYYGTGELIGSADGGRAPYSGDGIFKSTDNGQSWELLPSTSGGIITEFTLTSQFNFVWNMAIDPSNLVEDEIYAATITGVSRSTDGGASWDIVLEGDGNNTPLFTDIAVDESGVVYAALSETGLGGESSIIKGIFRSENGINWANITPLAWPEEFNRTVMSIAPSNPDVVYFISDSQPAPTLWKYTYQSGNGVPPFGGIWEDLSDNIPAFEGELGDFNTQDSYNMLVEVHPEDEDIVFLGGTNLYRSIDGFSTTENTDWIGGYNPDPEGSFQYPNHHADQHAIVFFPSDVNKMLSGHDGGVSITADNQSDTISWENLNNGYITSQFYGVALHPTIADPLVVGGTQDNGTYATVSESFMEDWVQIGGGDGGFCAVSSQGLIYISFPEGEIYRLDFTSNEGAFFARVDPLGAGQVEGQEYLPINPFVLDPNNSNTMYVAGGDQVWYNSDLKEIPNGSQEATSVNWQPVPSTQISDGRVSALTVSKIRENVLYYGTSNGRIFKTSNAHTEKAVTTDITSTKFPESGYVSNISVDPANANNILVVFSNYSVISIFYSRNGGATFSAVSGNLEEFSDGTGSGPSVRWTEIIPLENNAYVYLAGTSTGLYSTSKLQGSDTEWIKEGEDIIGSVVVPTIKYRAIDGQVIIGTHGNGIYARQYENVLKNFERPVLSQNYPNPFNENTTIRFNASGETQTKIEIYNAIGKKVVTLISEPGESEIVWDGRNAYGALLPDGMYFYRLENEGEKITKRLIIQR